MISVNNTDAPRENNTKKLTADFVVAGGGLAGVSAAVQAARAGLEVILINDRPVLGGNASSEVRLWALGATSHMGNNNRWSREGGFINELLLENLYRNKEGNPVIFDTVVLDKVKSEPNITLLLNCAVNKVVKSESRRIKNLEAFCSQNSTSYEIHGEQFCDATGDGIVAHNSGASFRCGAEAKSEFGELMAPDKENKELLGHTIFFYSKDTGKPVRFIAPSYANKSISEYPRSKILNKNDSGCRLWWIEYGGALDTVYDTEDIKWELWSVIYGIWDHIKNSGEFSDVENLTLEWVGSIPGKRESRRFNGGYMLTQKDIIEQTRFDDAVAFGGWAIDLHPAEGVYSDRSPCSQWHTKGVYEIPFRSYFSKDIDNLFLAGRIISATHLAFGSTRVMLTCAHGAQAVGEAAAMCIERKINPFNLVEKPLMIELQQRLSLSGQSIPGVAIAQENNLAHKAKVSSSSVFNLEQDIDFNGSWYSLSEGFGQLIPLKEGFAPKVSILLDSETDTELVAELRVSEKKWNYTPEATIGVLTIPVKEGKKSVELDFSSYAVESQYGFLILKNNKHVNVKTSTLSLSGITSVFNKENKAVSNSGRQIPPQNSGVDEFEFWTPNRRPASPILAMKIKGGVHKYSCENLLNGYVRPWLTTNAWVAGISDKAPNISFKWNGKEKVSGVILFFDPDYDDAMESLLIEHHNYRTQHCVNRFSVYDGNGSLIYECSNNYQARVEVPFDKAVFTDQIRIEMEHPDQDTPAALFEVYVY